MSQRKLHPCVVPYPEFIKKLVFFLWRTVYWADVTFPEELFAGSVSQLCAEDDPPSVREHKVRCISVLTKHLLCCCSSLECVFPTSITEPKKLMTGYYKNCSQLSCRLVYCAEYTGFDTKMESCFLPCLSCLANVNRFMNQFIQGNLMALSDLCELLHMRNYMCLTDT